ncbi:sensor histidine kinase [Caulobacter mirabilis]|uniref:histidine kinase n=1 Tax=Caulobacter mirabilis TaxID=69666 RepID=A0A2D2B389_9CAUL|nr:PAS domain-containing sensor histidine kinase [Caulobacter mirabilis]ATQ44732.1 two-component sensor histidine kinase [Caulobacter mirabilis]
MTQMDLIAAAAAGAVCLAVGTTLWSLSQRRMMERRLQRLQARLEAAEGGAEVAQASAEAFDSALLVIDDGRAHLASGEESLAACAAAFGLAESDPQAIVNALMRADPDHAVKLRALFERGEPCAFEARGPQGAVAVEGRAAGALAWLRLTAASAEEAALPSAARMAAFLDGDADPAWIASSDGAVQWANRAWLDAVGARDFADAAARRLSLDKGADVLAAEAANLGDRREMTRWISVAGRRKSLRVVAQPLQGGGVGVRTIDGTQAQETQDAFKRHVEAHDETLNHIAEAVAIFGPTRRLVFHNAAFAQLWALEPAWLAERPTHGEILDRLRQRQRLPETADYAKWKAGELSRYEALGPQPDDLWNLPDGRTLRLVRQPHPMGGLLLLFSDITDDLKLKAQYNAQLKVQQATLDKLNDAVVVFGSDGRLRLHNEAFERFWNVTAAQLEEAGDFERVVELCVPRLHDMAFWRELKGRVADPDPEARAPTSGEAKTSDGRILSWQSRPLPDGATLIAFDDISDARRLEGALADREAALDSAERLKREFVGNVSYELRTPLTTIIGYAELLDRMGEAIPDRGRVHLSAVRQAATQLGRSIDDVLDIAAIDADEMALETGDVRVEDLITETAGRWAHQAEAQKVTLKLEVGEDVGLIRGDWKRLGQTLDHLVENALRQTPPEGVVTLSAVRAAGEVRLAVSDTGRGVPFHVQAHIFDRFVGRDRGGPGLGLALVKALVELHGGWVALESEPNNGSTFTCHLPEAAQIESGQRELGF